MADKLIWTAMGMEPAPDEYTGARYVSVDDYNAVEMSRAAAVRQTAGIIATDPKKVGVHNVVQAAEAFADETRYNKLIGTIGQRLIAAVDAMRNPK